MYICIHICGDDPLGKFKEVRLLGQVANECEGMLAFAEFLFIGVVLFCTLNLQHTRVPFSPSCQWSLRF